ncbi:MAG: hypothetical protein KBC38_01790 [Candidatus Pacebacteria bacterium]|nr:hypothetical protein [Candidatus Paceibacterota bacterium]MBP9840025.1 hypothetical protein [Candidatus Paceibacterota bacterium]
MARKKEEVAEEAISAEDGGSEVRVYELAFHLDPELSETEAGKVYEAIKAAAGSAIVAEGTLEKVQLAYTISRSETAGRRDFDSAYFGWVAYEADGEGHEAAIASVKGNSKVVRYLDIRTTKEEAKHSAEMKELRQMPAEAADEPVSDTELDAALENAVA